LEDDIVKRFGFLSFGHYSLKPDKTGKYGAQETLKQAVELGQIADELGVNGAYFRVHHFAPQYSAPIPLLSAIAATTNTIEVGTGVIDMRYENPLGLAEEVAALDLLSDQRIAIGVSRGSPETALRGWEAFGYGGPELAQEDPKGAALAAEKFDTFLAALRGDGMATAAPFEQQYPQMFRSGTQLPVLPHSPGADRRIWWGAATHASAELAARKGVNLMSSTLVFETNGSSLGDVQAEQIARYRREWEKAGHDWEPRVSVSRPIFPIVDGSDAQIFGPAGSGESHDSIGVGEDGPTHQPVEHLAALRAIPGLSVVRPGDANETAAAWAEILRRHDEPAGIALSRQNLTVSASATAAAEGVRRGAYVLAEATDTDGHQTAPEVVLIATGSEVGVAVAAREILQEEGTPTRVVSAPCLEWFAQQDAAYREQVLPAGTARVAIEAGISLGWREIVGDAGEIVSIDHYGSSAPGTALFEEYGFTGDNVAARARQALAHTRG